jgi:hypothetical protein
MEQHLKDLSTYEKCEHVRYIIVKTASEVMTYTNWSDDFAAKQLREIPKRLLETVGPIEISELTSEEMDALDFATWSKENPIRLIPLWLYHFLPDKIFLTCIDGVSRTYKKSELDADNRAGCIAYGIHPRFHY